MAGMAAEGREIPIADRELTRGRRGTHSDRAHHHRRWFRAPARCRSETGAPPSPRFCSVGGTRFRPPLGGRCRSETGGRPRAFAQLGVRGFDRLRRRCRSETGAPSRPRVLLSWGYAVSTASRRSMPVGDRRSAVRAFCSVGGTRFRPPPGGRCRSETGAPPSARFCSVGGTRFRPPLGGRRPRAFAQLGVPPPSETGAPPSRALLLSWGYAVSTASRRSMPVGDRRSAVPVLVRARRCAISMRVAQ